MVKRRSNIEPIFFHLKSDKRIKRNLLKVKEGDHTNAVLAICGFNLRILYAVFLLPILKCLKNSITEKYFLLFTKLNEHSFIFVLDTGLFQ